MDTRKDLLRRLLDLQRTVGLLGNFEGDLIGKSELEAIRSLWRVDEQDWADSVPQIYREAIGVDLNWTRYEGSSLFHVGRRERSSLPAMR